MGTAENPAMPDGRSNVSASIAPSAAPAETPSVNGVASGLRSSACSTTPDAASDEPTRTPASTRGRRATKKICASAFSANGIDESKTRQRLIDVEPTSGARRQTIDRGRAEEQPRDRDSARDAHGCGDSAARATGMTVSWPVLAFAVMSTSTPYSLRMSAGSSIASVAPAASTRPLMQQHQLAAEARRKVQVVGRDDDRQVALAVQLAEESSGSRADRRDPARPSARRAEECPGFCAKRARQ